MNPKLLIYLLSFFLLVSCNQDKILDSDLLTSDYEVYIDIEKIDSLEYNDSIYVPLEKMETFDIDVLYNKDKVVINKSEFPKSFSNERPYIWYIDQGETGLYSADNCGPSTTVMASLWQNEDFEITTQKARSEFRPNGGWWYTDDIEDFLDDYKISYEIDGYDGYEEILISLNQGNIVLLCIDTRFISYSNDDDDRFGKFYYYSGGHFIIVKGYTYIDNKLYYEVYDSNCWGENYSDGSPKGKDRLYPADEIDISIEEWWDYYIIIEGL